MTAITELESIGDIMENNLAHLAETRAASGIEFDPESTAALEEFHHKIMRAFTSAMVAFVSDNEDAAHMVMNMKEEINRMDSRIRALKAWGLQEMLSPERIANYTRQVDMVDNLKRIYYHTKRVAKLVVREEGAAAWGEAGIRRALEEDPRKAA